MLFTRKVAGADGRGRRLYGGNGRHPKPTVKTGKNVSSVAR